MCVCVYMHTEIDSSINLCSKQCNQILLSVIRSRLDCKEINTQILQFYLLILLLNTLK